MHKYGERKTTRIMMATVRHVTYSSGLRKFRADEFLFDGVYLRALAILSYKKDGSVALQLIYMLTTADRTRSM